MLIATWILALATLVLAIEGATFLKNWLDQLRPGRKQREINELNRKITLLQHAIWMDVSRAGQGTATKGDEQVRIMLQLDGWAPDVELMEQAGHFDLHRLMGRD